MVSEHDRRASSETSLESNYQPLMQTIFKHIYIFSIFTEMDILKEEPNFEQFSFPALSTLNIKNIRYMYIRASRDSLPFNFYFSSLQSVSVKSVGQL